MTQGNHFQGLGAIGALAERARGWAERLPGAAFAQRQARTVEELLLRELRKRLARLDGDSPGAQAGSRSPDDALRTLMERSLDQRPDTAERDLFLRLIDQLVPDEARIVAALSDGSRIAVCHLDARSRLGGTSIRVLSDASRIGSECGVMLTDRVPYYLEHLHELALLEAGPEDRSLGGKYELIETDSMVRAAITRIESEMKMRAQLTRASAALSPLGLKLWQACQPAAQ